MTADNIAGYVTDTGRTTPCEARPSTGFHHPDGLCQCFVGGPAPEFGPTRYGLGHPESVNGAPGGTSGAVVTDPDEGVA